METVGQILRNAREKKGLLLREVAASAELDQSILSKIERGTRKPSKKQLFKIAKILGLNKEKLLIHYLSEKIAYEIAEEEAAGQVLKIAESKVKYLIKSGNGRR